MSKSTGRIIVILLAIAAAIAAVILGKKWLQKNRHVNDNSRGAC
jgi:hypothetical protein